MAALRIDIIAAEDEGRSMARNSQRDRASSLSPTWQKAKRRSVPRSRPCSDEVITPAQQRNFQYQRTLSANGRRRMSTPDKGKNRQINDQPRTGRVKLGVIEFDAAPNITYYGRGENQIDIRTKIRFAAAQLAMPQINSGCGTPAGYRGSPSRQQATYSQSLRPTMSVSAG